MMVILENSLIIAYKACLSTLDYDKMYYAMEMSIVEFISKYLHVFAWKLEWNIKMELDFWFWRVLIGHNRMEC